MNNNIVSLISLAIAIYSVLKEEPELKGAKGDKGEPGATGATGAKGDKGDPGEPGETGAKGDKGDPGEPGETGAKGDKGDPGEPGETGAKGDKGDPGEPGETGAKGDKGDPGEPGETGAKGDKGDPGEPGETGAKGDKGDPGEPGETPIPGNGLHLDWQGQLHIGWDGVSDSQQGVLTTPLELRGTDEIGLVIGNGKAAFLGAMLTSPEIGVHSGIIEIDTPTKVVRIGAFMVGMEDSAFVGLSVNGDVYGGGESVVISNPMGGGLKYDPETSDMSTITFDDYSIINQYYADRRYMRITGTYVDNAAAIAGGLSVGRIYKTPTGEIRVVV